MLVASRDIIEALAEACEAQAALFLDCPPDGLDEQQVLATPRPFAVDAREWIANHGDEDPAGWLSRTVVSYLAEASHQLRLLSLVLTNRAVHGTLGPLVRAVLERSGRVCWLLDPDASAGQRGARAQLELGVCALHYADTLCRLGSPDEIRTEIRRWRGEHRNRVHNRYAVETNDANKDMSKWKVDGESYPDYTEMVGYALNHDPGSAAIYAVLSGMSHPNVFVAQEGQQQILATRNVMVLHTDSLERLLRIALASHIAAVKRWAAFYLDQSTADAVVQEADRLADVLDEASVLADIRRASDATASSPADDAT